MEDSIIEKIDEFKRRTYPLGRNFDYSKAPKIIGLPTWEEYEELKKLISQLMGKSSKSIKLKGIIKKREMKPHSGGFNKPCLLNTKMSKIIQENLQNGSPNHELENDCIIYTHGLLTNWWSKYINENNLRNESNGTILKYEGLLKEISTPYLEKCNIDLNADPIYKRVKKLETEDDIAFNERKANNKDKRFTYGNFQRILAKYIDKRLKNKNYEDYVDYFEKEKKRLNTYYPVLKVMKPKNYIPSMQKQSKLASEKIHSKKSSIEKSSNTDTKNDNFKKEIMDILNENDENEDSFTSHQIDIDDIEDF